MAKVAVISTGGTINSVGTSRLDLAYYPEAKTRLKEGELIALLPELKQIAEVSAIPYRRVSSYALTMAELSELAKKAGALLNGDFDAVVVCHGTNTMEETGFALHLVLPPDKPVVMVGAMRPASALGSDGPLNLIRAVQVAVSPAAAGLGVLVVMNDTIHSVRHVTKTATFRVEAFGSVDTGPLGYADADGQVVIYQQPRAVEPVVSFDADALTEMPRVDIVISHIGADGAIVDAAVAAGARGLVSAGTGAGRVTPAEDDALDRAIAAGVVVCQASRVIGGRVPRSPLMSRRRIVAAGDLQPWKARILLGLALTGTSDPEEIQWIFDRV